MCAEFHRAGCIGAALCTAVWTMSGCGSSAETPAPGSPVGHRPDVTVTVDGVHHVCNVALAREAQSSSVECPDVAAFLKDELRLPSGAVYDLRTVGQADASDMVTLSSHLKSAGYRLVTDR